MAEARAAYDSALGAGRPTGIALRRDAYAAAHTAFEAALARIAHAPPVMDNPLAETPASRFILAYHGSGDRELQERLAAL